MGESVVAATTGKGLRAKLTTEERYVPVHVRRNLDVTRHHFADLDDPRTFNHVLAVMFGPISMPIVVLVITVLAS